MSKRAYTQVQALVPEIQEMLYLSMIRDLYGNSIVAYKTAARRTANLVLDTIRLAIKKEKKRVAAELQLHSDQGLHILYRRILI